VGTVERYLDRDAPVTVTRLSPGLVRVAFSRGRVVTAGYDAGAVVGLGAGVAPETAWRVLGLRPVRALMASAGLWLVHDARGQGDGITLASRLAAEVERGRWLVAAVPDLAVAHRAARWDTPPNDPRYPGQWYLARIGMEAAWALGTGHRSVSVAVVDNGCEVDHPDLAVQFDPGLDVLDGDDDPRPLATEPGANHGTACSGVIGAAGNNGVGVVGVCPACRLRCVRMLGARGQRIALSRNIAAFDFALTAGVSVVSNSWGFGDPMPVPGPLATAMERVYDEGRGGLGALVVFAAGNENRVVEPDEIYGVRGVVTVGATTLFDEATSFSNRGMPVAVTAPTGTVTTDLSGPVGENPGDYTALFGGTSSACPVVSGVAALMFAACPSVTSRVVHDALLATARPAPYATPDARGHDVVYGFGIVDPAAALRALPCAVGTPDAGAMVSDASPDAAMATASASEGCGCRSTGVGRDGFGVLGVMAALCGWMTKRRRR